MQQQQHEQRRSDLWEGRCIVACVTGGIRAARMRSLALQLLLLEAVNQREGKTELLRDLADELIVGLCLCRFFLLYRPAELRCMMDSGL